MANLLKHAFLIVMSLSTSAGVVRADFDQGILDRAMGMTSDAYQVGGKLVAPAVQAANFLTEDLRKESDSVRAKNIADTLIAVLSTGQGVGGISETPANEGERPLMVGALQEAARFLKALEHPNQKDFALVQKPHEQSHLARVTTIMQSAYAEDRPVVAYNAALQKAITDLHAKELAADGDPKDYTVWVGGIVAANQDGGDPLKAVKALTALLKTTVIPEKAHQLAVSIFRDLKGVNFADVVPSSAIDALISVEAYRMFETTQGALGKADPALFSYQGTAQSDKSEAVLLALVSAIQNYLYNSAATPEVLVRLFKYQINSRKLVKPAVRDAAKAMIRNGEIGQIITQGLIDRVKAMLGQMRITAVQKLVLDAVVMKQALMFYSVPAFNMGTLRKVDTSPQFLRYFGSSGSGLQCGFFSLGFQSRQDALDQILDNLVEPEILAMADRNVSCSSDIRRLIDRYVKYRGKTRDELVGALVAERLEAEKVTLRSRRAASLKIEEKDRNSRQVDLAKLSDQDIEDKIEAQKGEITKDQQAEVSKMVGQKNFYAGLYAKRHKIENLLTGDAEEKKRFFDRFLDEYAQLMAEVLRVEKETGEQIEKHKADKGIKGEVSDDDAAMVSVMRRDLERQRWQAQARLISFIYSLEDFQELVRKSMGEKFSSGELEFDPNPDWDLRVPTYPQMLAELNGYNIYAWVTKSQFERMQRARGASTANPVHQSEDGEYILANYLNGSPNGKDVGLLNKSGGHFEKWIAAGDYARLARAARHQKTYSLPDTTNDRPSSRGSTTIDWPF